MSSESLGLLVSDQVMGIVRYTEQPDGWGSVDSCGVSIDDTNSNRGKLAYNIA